MWYAWRMDQGSQKFGMEAKPVYEEVSGAFVDEFGVFDDGYERFTCTWHDTAEEARAVEKTGS